MFFPTAEELIQMVDIQIEKLANIITITDVLHTLIAVVVLMNMKTVEMEEVVTVLNDDWYAILYVIGGLFFVFVVIPSLWGLFEIFRDKERKLKNERLQKDKRHKNYLFLKRKQYNQNDEYIPNQLTAEENIQYNELKEEFTPKPKIEKPSKSTNQNYNKNAYRTELKDGKLYSYTFFESVLMDLEDLFLFRWILKRINNKNLVTKTLLVLLLSPFYLGVFLLLWIGGLTIFVWLFAKIAILIIEAYNWTSSFF